MQFWGLHYPLLFISDDSQNEKRLTRGGSVKQKEYYLLNRSIIHCDSDAMLLLSVLCSGMHFVTLCIWWLHSVHCKNRHASSPVSDVDSYVIVRNLLDSVECRLLGCSAVWVYYKPTFRINAFSRSSTLKIEAKRSSETSVYKPYGATTQKTAFFIFAAM
jgi:hypothetical protein